MFWKGHKIWKNLPLKICRYRVMSNFKWKIFSNFVAFSEYPNFNTSIMGYSLLGSSEYKRRYVSRIWVGWKGKFANHDIDPGFPGPTSVWQDNYRELIFPTKVWFEVEHKAFEIGNKDKLFQEAMFFIIIFTYLK